MADHSGVDTFIAGFFIGGVIGAGVALLFAPTSGKETRQYLLSQAGTAIESGKDELDKVRQLIHEELARLGESKQALHEAIHSGVETFKKHGKATVTVSEETS